ncbi:histone deacetylase [Halomicroarcula sp. GCM10025817]|uniref:histone deacetylase family protein n=1 Tax=Haloarcula TaxID=2237 RepID=UPI0023E78A42|nr:histone deacetylase [Halomicroarcula sp. SYNS111]
MALALVYDDAYLEYEITPTHPERSERLVYTLARLEEEGLFDHPAIDVRSPSRATTDDLLRVHEKSYLSRLRRLSRRGRGALSGDTRVTRETWETARLAAGGLCRAGDLVANDEYDAAYAMVRPPGHHAGRDTGHGFCYVNNTAVLVRHLQQAHGDDRVVIWDIDAHHCDGTQDIFYDDPDTLVISAHQDPETQFPNTGSIDETGDGAGVDTQINIPLPPGAGDDAYERVVNDVFVPATRTFDPDFLVVEAGHDAHFSDFTSDLQMTAAGYRTLIRHARETALDVCDGRIVAGLSGGYSIEDGLPFTTLALIAELADLEAGTLIEPGEPPEPTTTLPEIEGILERVRSAHDRRWWP